MGGLLKKWWRIKRPENAVAEMFVYPALVPLDAQSIYRLRSGDEQDVLGNERGEGSTILGLREYQSSDNPRRIHWKASAKLGAGGANNAWLVRELEKEQEFDVLIELPSTQEARGMDSSEIELLIRYGASLLEECRKSGQPVRLIIADEEKAGLYQEIRSYDNDQAPWEFLSLWDPKAPLDSKIKSYVAPLSESTEKIGVPVRLLPAFLAWRSQVKSNE